MWNIEDAAVAAAHSVSPGRWWDGFGEVMDRIGSRFVRYEPRRHAAAMMLGLLSGLDRKNCWTIAEHRGDVSPDGLQHLLSRAKWDADGVRDDLRGYVIEYFGDPGAVLVIDETGDVKKGSHSVGVQRQYTGTAGRIENAQVAVFLTYAARRGHALIDRALYLPKSWIGDQQRRRQAGIPEEASFATKPALATAMITAAVEAGVPASWVAGDEVYGADPNLRAQIRHAGLGYVLQVAANRRMPTAAGPVRVDELATLVPERGWQKASAGTGSKGERFYPWAWIDINDEPEYEHPDEVSRAGQHHLLIRRNDATGELAYHRCYTPPTRATDHPGPHRRATLAGRGKLPSLQRTHRPGPAPSPPLDLMAPLDHPGHARPRLPRRHHRRATRGGTHPGRDDPADRQRVPAAIRRPAARPNPHPHQPAQLVHLATTTPSPSTRKPLPKTRTQS